MPLYVSLALLVLSFGLLMFSSLLYDDAGRAWEVFIGITAPWSNSWWTSAVGVVLSTVGYLIVPTTIALLVTFLIETWVRDRRIPLAQVQDEIEAEIDRARSKGDQS